MAAEQDGRDALAQILVANDGEVISRLRLSAAEAARVCNVTPRQLIYWTRKGLVRPSTDDEHDYDVFAMEKVIRIRQLLEKGYSLEKAALMVDRDLASLGAEVERLRAMTPDQLEEDLRRRLEELEERARRLRGSLAASLGVARLRRAVAALARLESAGAMNGAAASGDSAKMLVIRISRAVTELEDIVREVQPAGA